MASHWHRNILDQDVTLRLCVVEALDGKLQQLSKVGCESFGIINVMADMPHNLDLCRRSNCDADFPRSCISTFAAMRPASWKWPFNVTDLGGFQPELFLHHVRIHTVRDEAAVQVSIILIDASLS
jgi:hypothetical protein